MISCWICTAVLEARGWRGFRERRSASATQSPGGRGCIPKRYPVRGPFVRDIRCGTSGICSKPSTAGDRRRRIPHVTRLKWLATRRQMCGLRSDWTNSGSYRPTNSSSFMSAPAIRSGGGPKRRLPHWFRRWRVSHRNGGSSSAQAPPIEPRRRGSRRRPDECWDQPGIGWSISGSSIWQSCGRSSSAAGCSSAGTLDRCILPPPQRRQ